MNKGTTYGGDYGPNSAKQHFVCRAAGMLSGAPCCGHSTTSSATSLNCWKSHGEGECSCHQLCRTSTAAAAFAQTIKSTSFSGGYSVTRLFLEYELEKIYLDYQLC